ncbi:MAG: adenine phosphoribosyltransferase [Cyanobacteria bacterium P01_H01_bin.74]
MITQSYDTTDTEQSSDVAAIRDAIRDIPDFPKPGIVFKDITTVLRDPALLKKTVDYFYHRLKSQNIAYVVGIESRGFIFGAPLAYQLNAGFVPIRKKGKLPGPVARQSYTLEYGEDVIEIHDDAIPAGARVVLIDDLLATGGTAAAACELLKQIQVEVVAIEFLIHLTFLNGQEKLPATCPMHAMIHY